MEVCIWRILRYLLQQLLKPFGLGWEFNWICIAGIKVNAVKSLQTSRILDQEWISRQGANKPRLRSYVACVQDRLSTPFKHCYREQLIPMVEESDSQNITAPVQ